MDISATSHHIRVSPRKLQLLVKSIKNLRPQMALVTLTHLNKSGSAPLKKVIASAVANAKSRNIASVDELQFKHIEVLPGSAMKRFRAVSRGMAHTYKKRMSHVRVTLQTVEKPVETDLKIEKKEVKKENSKAQNPKS